MFPSFTACKRKEMAKKPARRRLEVERLEGRITPSTFTLTEDFNAPGTSPAWEGRNFAGLPGHPNSMPAPFETGPDSLSSGEFLRLKEFTASGFQRSLNTAGFAPVDSADFVHIVVDLDFRITAGGTRVRGSGFDFRTADGFSIALMNTDVYGTSGLPFPLDELGRSSTATRSFALGFNTFDNLEGTNNSVVLTFNNGFLATRNLNLAPFSPFDVVSGSNRIRGPFQHVHMDLTLGGSSPQVTVTLTDAAGNTITPFDQVDLSGVVVGGVPLAPYNSRLILSTRTGDSQESVDIDNVAAHFTTAVTNQAPTAEPGGPYAVPEGGSLVLDGTASSDPDGTVASYEWDLDYDGTTFDVDATGSMPTFSAAGLDGPSSRTIALRVIDDEGAPSSVAATTVAIENVAPVASVAGPATGMRGELLTFTLGASDDAAADQAAGFHYSIDWDGDGVEDETADGLDGTTVQHAFADAGPATVIVTATDKDGGVSSPVSLAVNIIQPVTFNVGPSQVNLNGDGVVPVSLLSTPSFLVTSLDVATLRLAGAAPVKATFSDLDNDGDLDLMLHFRRQDLVDAYAAALVADLADGTLDDNHQAVALAITGKTTSGADILGAAIVDLFMTGKKLNDLLESLGY